MHSVAYRFSQNYIQAKTRGPINGAIVFALLMAGIALVLVLGDTLSPAVAAILFVAAASIMFIKNRKLSREAAAHLPQVVVELSPDELCFSEPGGRIELKTSSITSVVVDRRAQEPRIVYLQRNSGETILIEGLDRLNQFVHEISKVVGSSKVRDLKWWQFPPR